MTINKEAAARVAGSSILVWDIPVRLMHWALAISVLGAWLTRELDGDFFVWHTRFGYAVLVVVVTRILWGFVGTRYARFSNFVRGPKAIRTYARQVLKLFSRDGHGESSAALTDETASSAIGHNPLGALMILAFMAMLLAQATTGLFANDQISETGPLFGYVAIETSDQLTSLHKQLFDWLVAAIAVHVAAALFYLWVRHENLIIPMITGRKLVARVERDSAITESRIGLAMLIAAGVAGVLAWLVRTAPPGSLYAF